MDKRYQVFVSSTFTDLIEERQNVIEALIKLRCLPAGMEFFPGSGSDKWEYIKKVIDDCDYYLLIIGGRYGSTDAAGISYTEKEYDYAIKKGLEPIVFIHYAPNKIPLEKSEIDPCLRERLHAFCEKVKTGLVNFWHKPEDLIGLTAINVGHIIQERPAIDRIKSNTHLAPPTPELKHYPDLAARRERFTNALKPNQQMKLSISSGLAHPWLTQPR